MKKKKKKPSPKSPNFIVEFQTLSTELSECFMKVEVSSLEPLNEVASEEQALGAGTNVL